MNPSPAENWSDDESYKVRGTFEIASVLRATINRRIRLRATSRHNSMTAMTCLMDVDPRNDCMFIDRAPDKELAACIFASHELRFDARIDNVLIDFTVSSATPAAHQGVEAWRMPLPAFVVRIQRREYHRLRAPAAPLLRVRLSPEVTGGSNEHDCDLSDISAGGFAANVTDRDFPLVIGGLHGCTINLKDFGVIHTQAQLRTCSAPRHSWGTLMRRAGFMFVDLSAEHQMRIHRFLLRLQRQRGLLGR